MFRSLQRMLAPLGASLLLLSGAASASTGGVRVIVQEWSPANPAVQTNRVVLDKPGLLGDALNEGWAKARGPVCDALKNYLGKGDLIKHGVTLYDIDCQMAQAGTLAVKGFANDLLTLTYTLPVNTIKAHVTTPTIFGKYADPCMFLSYDVSMTTSIHLGSLTVDNFAATIDNVSRPDSCNTAGDIEKFAATTYHFFGGPDYLARMQDAIDRTEHVDTAPLDKAMASFVAPIQSYSQMYSSRTNWIRNGNIYVALAPKYDPSLVPATAGIDGSIEIVKNDRIVASPDCSTFSLSGRVQTGPAPIFDPVNLTVTDPPFATVGSGQATGTAMDAGSRYTCAYTAIHMPPGVPVKYDGSGIAGPAERGRSAYRVGLLPDGWSGKVALQGVAQDKNFLVAAIPNGSDYTTQYLPNQHLTFDTHPNYNSNPGVDPAATQTFVKNAANAATNLRALNPQPLPPAGTNADLSTGNRLFQNGDFAGAAAAFSRSHLADASNAIALHNLAAAHARLGQGRLAASEFRQAADLAHANGDIATEQAADKAIIIVGGAQR